MKKRCLSLLILLGCASALALSSCSAGNAGESSFSASSTASKDTTSSSSSEDNLLTVDYSSSKWTDYSGHSLWSVDSDSSIFNFYSNVSDEDDAQRWDKAFTQNMLITDQFDTDVTVVTMEATFQGTTDSQDIINLNDDEVHFGIVPWYKDSDNWILCYAKFSRDFTKDDDGNDVPSIKNGRLTNFLVYAKLNGSTFVDFYVKDDDYYENKWISPGDSLSTEWHIAWPDRVNSNKNPTTLQETEPDPSDEMKILVRKTRKTYAKKECDSFYVKVNDYELNFGLDNFMFSGLREVEDADESFVPKVGFYLYGTRKATVKDFSISVSNEEILPVPTVEPLSNPTTSGTVNKKIAVPDFAAYNNDGETIAYSLVLTDPDGETLYPDGEDYFIPTKIGSYQVKATAIDKDGLVGEYSYVVKVKDGTAHVDTDVYDDVLTPLAKDTSIIAAYVIFISVPVLIAGYIGFKVFMYFRKKKKGE